MKILALGIFILPLFSFGSVENICPHHNQTNAERIYFEVNHWKFSADDAYNQVKNCLNLGVDTNSPRMAMVLNNLVRNSFANLAYLKVVDLVLEVGVDINNTNYHKESVLDNASKYFVLPVSGYDGLDIRMFDKNQNGYEVVDHLILKGAKVNNKNSTTSPLFEAASGRQVPNFLYWINLGADPNFINFAGKNVLMEIMSSFRMWDTPKDFGDWVYQGVKELVKGGVNIHHYDKRDGWSPIAWGVINGYYKATKYLLELGADPNIPTRAVYRMSNGELWKIKSCRPLNYTMRIKQKNERKKFQKLLLKHGAFSTVTRSNENGSPEKCDIRYERTRFWP